MSIIDRPSTEDPDEVDAEMRAVERDTQDPLGGIWQPLRATGEFLVFCGEVFRTVPMAVREYPGEVVRHAADLVRQNIAVILFMQFMLGAVLTLTLNFLFANLGLDTLISAATGVGGIRGIIEIIFGWIVAAKIGCGIVAEIGAMRISDEIDAMEVMGVPSVPYLITTRVVAGVLVLPMLFITGMAVYFSASFLFGTTILHTVSPGGFINILFLFQNLRDFVLAIIWGVTYGVIILLTSSYFGYTAKGGPVGVGRNTAQSMLVNLVMVSLVGMLLIQIFYGDAPNAPIGN